MTGRPALPVRRGRSVPSRSCSGGARWGRPCSSSSPCPARRCS
ncbi:hypothetical protein ACFPM0_33535 [Pseudonocardia sulfidoxydans]